MRPTVPGGCDNASAGIVPDVLTSFDDGRLFGQVHGSSEPRVLALHGWRRDHRDFDRVLGGSAVPNRPGVEVSTGDLPLPESALPAIALDLPGFGGTPPPAEALGADGYAEAVAPVLDQMSGPIIVIGHSFGGRVAVELAARQPAMVGGVVLTGAPLFPADPGVKGRRSPIGYRVVRSLARRGLVGDERLEAMKSKYGSADYRAAIGVMRDVLVRAIAEEREEAYTAALEAISCPVELVWGELDTAAPPRVADRIAATLGSRVSLQVVPGVPHLTPDVIPGHLRAGIDRLLAAEHQAS